MFWCTSVPRAVAIVDLSPGASPAMTSAKKPRGSSFGFDADLMHPTSCLETWGVTASSLLSTNPNRKLHGTEFDLIRSADGAVLVSQQGDFMQTGPEIHGIVWRARKVSM